MRTIRTLTPMALMLLTLLMIVGSVSAQATHRIYLPTIRSAPISMFASETSPGRLARTDVKTQAAALGASWIRLNGVLWHEVQPVQGGPYNWNALATFERDLAVAQELGLIPVVIVRGTPQWAGFAENLGSDGQYALCSATRDDALPAYAAFLEALATRYRGQVNYWEIGNEPDVDPRLVPSNFEFGCLGQISDPYYGGERYGRLLNAAAPALRRGNPNAKIVFGGLLLDRPETTDPNYGRPERFLEGALVANAAGSFDILAYHAYPSFYQTNADADLTPNRWQALGGYVIGKARYIKEVLSRYNVQKPLWLNETGLLCTPPYAPCDPPTNAFFQNQAEMMPRLFARAAAEGVTMVSWYTLDGPSWRNAGLLDANQQPRLAFYAYQQMARKLVIYRQVQAVDYGPNLEAYRFNTPTALVDVLWSRSAAIYSVDVPTSSFIRASNLYGEAINGTVVGGNTRLTVGFAPIYIERRP